MIGIVNMGPHDPKSPMGWRNYEVRINNDVIARFQHKRSDGLGRCLLEASKAIERQKWEELADGSWVEHSTANIKPNEKENDT